MRGKTAVALRALGPPAERIRDCNLCGRPAPATNTFLKALPSVGKGGGDWQRLEEFRRYPESRLWSLHREYFRRRGSAAWTVGEIPVFLTGNRALARQCGEVVYELLAARRAAGERGRLEVLELGAGLGLFALYLVDALEALEGERGAGVFPQLRYWLTDFAPRGIEEAGRNPAVARRVEEGRIALATADALDPGAVTPLGEEAATHLRPIAILGNYLHCCLPLTLFRRQGEEWREKYVELSTPVAAADAAAEGGGVLADRLADPSLGELFPVLAQRIEWRPVELEERLPWEEERRAVEAILEGLGDATYSHPAGSMEHLRRAREILSPGGAVLAVDKGVGSTEAFRGATDFEPSLHGNSLAHLVNFPLLAEYGRRVGLEVVWSAKAEAPLHALLAGVMIPAAAREAFARSFVERDHNLEAQEFHRRGREAQVAGDATTAVELFRKVLALRPEATVTLYDLGNALVTAGELEEGLRTLQRGKATDLFQVIDFDFKIGLTLQRMGDWEGALEPYRLSHHLYPCGTTLSNIALSYEAMGRLPQALEAYQAALQLAPGDASLRRTVAIIQISLKLKEFSSPGIKEHGRA